MTMPTPSDGVIVLRFLQSNLREAFTLAQICTGCGFRNSANGRRRARRGIVEARAMAWDLEGNWFIADAVPAEGHVYRLTDQGVDAAVPATHARLRALGSVRRANEHDEFMSVNTAGMSRSQRLELEARRMQAEARKIDDEATRLRLVAQVENDREIRRLRAMLEDRED